MLGDPSLAGADAERELSEIVRGLTGRELSSRVVGQHPSRVSLTDLFGDGARLANAVRAVAEPGDAVLEYQGGLGQVAHAVAPRVTRLVSVDGDPRVGAYGSVLTRAVEFLPLDQLPATETFDGAYAIGVFDRLSPGEWESALNYLSSHLAPGGWLLLNPAAPGEEFRALYEPLFRGRLSPLRDGSMVLEKLSTNVQAPPVAPGERWAVDQASVVADVLGDEVVVVDLDSGAYYILEGSARVIWQLLAAGEDVPAIVTRLSAAYPEHASEMEGFASDFTAQLVGEGLLIPAAEGGMRPAIDARELGIEAPFAPPEMFRYTEMEALIQMDPIREYDETGWPRRPADRSRRR